MNSIMRLWVIFLVFAMVTVVSRGAWSLATSTKLRGFEQALVEMQVTGKDLQEKIPNEIDLGKLTVESWGKVSGESATKFGFAATRDHFEVDVKLMPDQTVDDVKEAIASKMGLDKQFVELVFRPSDGGSAIGLTADKNNTALRLFARKALAGEIEGKFVVRKTLIVLGEKLELETPPEVTPEMLRTQRKEEKQQTTVVVAGKEVSSHSLEAARDVLVAAGMWLTDPFFKELQHNVRKIVGSEKNELAALLALARIEGGMVEGIKLETIDNSPIQIGQSIWKTEYYKTIAGVLEGSGRISEVDYNDFLSANHKNEEQGQQQQKQKKKEEEPVVAASTGAEAWNAWMLENSKRKAFLGDKSMKEKVKQEVVGAETDVFMAMYAWAKAKGSLSKNEVNLKNGAVVEVPESSETRSAYRQIMLDLLATFVFMEDPNNKEKFGSLAKWRKAQEVEGGGYPSFEAWKKTVFTNSTEELEIEFVQEQEKIILANSMERFLSLYGTFLLANQAKDKQQGATLGEAKELKILEEAVNQLSADHSTRQGLYNQIKKERRRVVGFEQYREEALYALIKAKGGVSDQELKLKGGGTVTTSRTEGRYKEIEALLRPQINRTNYNEFLTLNAQGAQQAEATGAAQEKASVEMNAQGEQQGEAQEKASVEMNAQGEQQAEATGAAQEGAPNDAEWTWEDVLEDLLDVSENIYGEIFTEILKDMESLHGHEKYMDEAVYAIVRLRAGFSSPQLILKNGEMINGASGLTSRKPLLSHYRDFEEALRLLINQTTYNEFLEMNAKHAQQYAAEGEAQEGAPNNLEDVIKEALFAQAKYKEFLDLNAQGEQQAEAEGEAQEDAPNNWEDDVIKKALFAEIQEDIKQVRGFEKYTDEAAYALVKLRADFSDVKLTLEDGRIIDTVPNDPNLLPHYQALEKDLSTFIDQAKYHEFLKVNAKGEQQAEATGEAQEDAPNNGEDVVENLSGDKKEEISIDTQLILDNGTVKVVLNGWKYVLDNLRATSNEIKEALFTEIQKDIKRVRGFEKYTDEAIYALVKLRAGFSDVKLTLEDGTITDAAPSLPSLLPHYQALEKDLSTFINQAKYKEFLDLNAKGEQQDQAAAAGKVKEKVLWEEALKYLDSMKVSSYMIEAIRNDIKQYLENLVGFEDYREEAAYAVIMDRADLATTVRLKLKGGKTFKVSEIPRSHYIRVGEIMWEHRLFDQAKYKKFLELNAKGEQQDQAAAIGEVQEKALAVSNWEKVLESLDETGITTQGLLVQMRRDLPNLVGFDEYKEEAAFALIMSRSGSDQELKLKDGRTVEGNYNLVPYRKLREALQPYLNKENYANFLRLNKRGIQDPSAKDATLNIDLFLESTLAGLDNLEQENKTRLRNEIKKDFENIVGSEQYASEALYALILLRTGSSLTGKKGATPKGLGNQELKLRGGGTVKSSDIWWAYQGILNALDPSIIGRPKYKQFLELNAKNELAQFDAGEQEGATSSKANDSKTWEDVLQGLTVINEVTKSKVSANLKRAFKNLVGFEEYKEEAAYAFMLARADIPLVSNAPASSPKRELKLRDGRIVEPSLAKQWFYRLIAEGLDPSRLNTEHYFAFLDLNAKGKQEDGTSSRANDSKTWEAAVQTLDATAEVKEGLSGQIQRELESLVGFETDREAAAYALIMAKAGTSNQKVNRKNGGTVKVSKTKRRYKEIQEALKPYLNTANYNEFLKVNAKAEQEDGASSKANNSKTWEEAVQALDITSGGKQGLSAQIQRDLESLVGFEGYRQEAAYALLIVKAGRSEVPTLKTISGEILKVSSLSNNRLFYGKIADDLRLSVDIRAYTKFLALNARGKQKVKENDPGVSNQTSRTKSKTWEEVVQSLDAPEQARAGLSGQIQRGLEGRVGFETYNRQEAAYALIRAKAGTSDRTVHLKNGGTVKVSKTKWRYKEIQEALKPYLNTANYNEFLKVNAKAEQEDGASSEVTKSKTFNLVRWEKSVDDLSATALTKKAIRSQIKKDLDNLIAATTDELVAVYALLMVKSGESSVELYKKDSSEVFEFSKSDNTKLFYGKIAENIRPLVTQDRFEAFLSRNQAGKQEERVSASLLALDLGGELVSPEAAARVQGFKGKANPFDTRAEGITKKQVKFRENDRAALKTETVYLTDKSEDSPFAGVTRWSPERSRWVGVVRVKESFPSEAVFEYTALFEAIKASMMTKAAVVSEAEMLLQYGLTSKAITADTKEYIIALGLFNAKVHALAMANMEVSNLKALVVGLRGYQDSLGELTDLGLDILALPSDSVEALSAAIKRVQAIGNEDLQRLVQKLLLLINMAEITLDAKAGGASFSQLIEGTPLVEGVSLARTFERNSTLYSA